MPECSRNRFGGVWRLAGAGGSNQPDTRRGTPGGESSRFGPMSRRQVLGGMTAGLAGVLTAGTGLASAARAQVRIGNANGSLIRVYPTGDAVMDTQNVQTAIDAVSDGGTVLLKAVDESGAPKAFEFGTDFIAGQFRIVILDKSLTLTGETVRRTKTTLRRGVALFKIQSSKGDVVRLRNVFSQGARGFFHAVYGNVDFEVDSVEAVDMTASPAGTLLGFLGHNAGRFCVRNCTYRSAAGATGVKWEGGISHYPFGAAATVEVREQRRRGAAAAANVGALRPQ